MTGQLPVVFVESYYISRLDTWTTGETELTVIFFERKWGSIAYVYGALILIRFEEGGYLSKAPTGGWYYKQFPSCYPISSIQNKLACSWNVCLLDNNY